MPIDAHRINLLPVAVAAKRRDRQLLMALVGGAAVVVLLLFLLWLQKGRQVNRAEGETDAQKAKNRQLQGEVAKLEYLEAKAKTVSDREALVKAAWQREVSWYRFLQDVATTMPSQTWLTSFEADSKVTMGKPGEGKPGAPAALLQAGQFKVAGKGFDHPDAGDWLARISQLKQVANAWVAKSAAVQGEGGTTPTITFDSTGTLTPHAWSTRAKRAVEGNLYDGTNAQ